MSKAEKHIFANRSSGNHSFLLKLEVTAVETLSVEIELVRKCVPIGTLSRNKAW
jgi:hypothetical protein